MNATSDIALAVNPVGEVSLLVLGILFTGLLIMSVIKARLHAERRASLRSERELELQAAMHQALLQNKKNTGKGLPEMNG